MSVQGASPEQRAAQKRVGYLRTCGYLTADGLGFWREREAGEWKASSEEIAADLLVLEVPSTTVTALQPPTTRSRGRQREGQEVRVSAADLPALQRWSPMLVKSVEQVPADAPGFAFTYLDPRPDGSAAVRKAPFAADWPSWTAKQAADMGLVCSRCSHDLRDHRDGKAVPAINRPAAGRSRRRLFCSGCDEVDFEP